MQHQFVEGFFRECRRRGIHTAIETSGYIEWENMEKVLEVTDLVLYDIKHINSWRHKEFTGVGNELILENFRRIAGSGIPITVRLPVIPGYNDSKTNIEDTARLLARVGNIREIHLLPYHRLGVSKYQGLGRTYKMGRLFPPSRKKVQECARNIESITGSKVRVGG